MPDSEFIYVTTADGEERALPRKVCITLPGENQRINLDVERQNLHLIGHVPIDVCMDREEFVQYVTTQFEQPKDGGSHYREMWSGFWAERGISTDELPKLLHQLREKADE